MKKIIIAITAVASIAVAVVVVRPEYISSVTSAEVLRVTRRGGESCDGPCPAPPVYVVYEDGVYSGHNRLTADEVQQLKSFTTALASVSGSGEGFCDSYVDGQDIVWIVPYTDKQIVPCEHTDPSSLKMIERVKSILYK